MKHYNLQLILIFLFCLIGFHNCSDDFDTFEQEEIISGEINSFLEGAKSQPVTFRINANQTESWTSPEGYVINFNESNFDQSLSGQEIEVSFSSMERVGDLILNNINTTDNGKVYAIESVLNIQMTAAGSPVKIFDGQNLEVLVPNGNSNPEIALFKIGVEKWFNESSQRSDALGLETWTDIAGQPSEGFKSNINSLGTYAIARELTLTNSMDMDPTSTICVDIMGDFNRTNTNVFFKINSASNLIPLNWNSENMLFCDKLGEVLPDGFGGKLISVTHDVEGKIHFGTKDVFIGDRDVFELTPEVVTIDELLARLEVI